MVLATYYVQNLLDYKAKSHNIDHLKVKLANNLLRQRIIHLDIVYKFAASNVD